MGAAKTYHCPVCRERFDYEIPPEAYRAAAGPGSVSLVVLFCPHCTQLLAIDPATMRIQAARPELAEGQARDTILVDSRSGGIDQLVDQLNAEADRLLQTDPARAEGVYRRALALRKHDPQTWYNLGVCQHRQGNLRGAVDCYRHALRFGAPLVQAYNNLGSALVQLNELAEAERCYDQGLALAPDYPKFFLGKGNIAMIRGDKEAARRHFQTALQKDSGYQPAREALRLLG
jgi:Flp pilus assembly protein TadD